MNQTFMQSLTMGHAWLALNGCLSAADGSYGVCNDPVFDTDRLSLLDRGFVFAIAHCRGGGEMGRQWYEDGKFLHKKNTFVDFIACAEHLVAKKYTSPPRLCAEVSSRSCANDLVCNIESFAQSRKLAEERPYFPKIWSTIDSFWLGQEPGVIELLLPCRGDSPPALLLCFRCGNFGQCCPEMHAQLSIMHPPHSLATASLVSFRGLHCNLHCTSGVQASLLVSKLLQMLHVRPRLFKLSCEHDALCKTLVGCSQSSVSLI